jgi:hypothetical protein
LEDPALIGYRRFLVAAAPDHWPDQVALDENIEGLVNEDSGGIARSNIVVDIA